MTAERPAPGADYPDNSPPPELQAAIATFTASGVQANLATTNLVTTIVSLSPGITIT